MWQYCWNYGVLARECVQNLPLKLVECALDIPHVAVLLALQVLARECVQNLPLILV